MFHFFNFLKNYSGIIEVYSIRKCKGKNLKALLVPAVPLSDANGHEKKSISSQTSIHFNPWNLKLESIFNLIMTQMRWTLSWNFNKLKKKVVNNM